MNLDEEEGFVYRREMTTVKVKIPKGNVKCPYCKGSGEIRVYYGQPWDRGQFRSCIYCNGKGFLRKKILASLKKMFPKEKST